MKAAGVILLLIVALPYLTSIKASPWAPPIHKGLPWVEIRGTHFITQNGTYVTFHGVDYTGLETYTPFIYSGGMSKQDFENIAAWGFNLVRLPIGLWRVEPEPWTYNKTYIELLQQVVAWANDYGIYIILDMNGVPTWMGNWYTTALWSNETDISLLAGAWAYVASSFSNNPGVLGYDIYNEPLSPPPSHWSYTAIYSALARADNACIASIRKVDQRHIIFYESAHVAASVSPQYWVEPVDPYHQLAIEIHDYGYGSNPAGSVAIVSAALNASNKWGVPVIVGEFGFTEDVSSLLYYVSYFDAHGFSWCYWSYGYDNDETLPGGRVGWIVTYALEEPYPELSSSPLSSLSVQRSAFSRAVTVKAQFSSAKGWALFFIPYGYSNPPGSFNKTSRLLNVTYSDGQVLLNLEGPPVNWAYAFSQVAVYIYVVIGIIVIASALAVYVKKKGLEAFKGKLESARKGYAQGLAAFFARTGITQLTCPGRRHKLL